LGTPPVVEPPHSLQVTRRQHPPSEALLEEGPPVAKPDGVHAESRGHVETPRDSEDDPRSDDPSPGEESTEEHERVGRHGRNEILESRPGAEQRVDGGGGEISKEAE